MQRYIFNIYDGEVGRLFLSNMLGHVTKEKAVKFAEYAKSSRLKLLYRINVRLK